MVNQDNNYVPQHPNYKVMAIVADPPDDEPGQEASAPRQPNRAPFPLLAQNPSSPPAARSGRLNSDAKRVYDPGRNAAPKLFAAPGGQEVSFAVEAPAGIKGISDNSSYIFITQNTNQGALTNTGWRAFIVSKDPPHKQKELALTNANLDSLKNHAFQAKFGDHSILVGLGGANVDGRAMRSLDTPQILSLVKQVDYAGSQWDTKGFSDYVHTGDSWAITKKDFQTGVITRFTQSGNSGKGTLEVIQGESTPEAGFGGAGTTEWLENGETKLKPQKVVANATMPEDMQKELVRSGMADRYSSLNEMVSNPQKLETNIRNENRQLVDRLNSAAAKPPRLAQPKM